MLCPRGMSIDYGERTREPQPPLALQLVVSPASTVHHKQPLLVRLSLTAHN